MRELTVRIKFLKHSLGNVKAENGCFLLPRSPSGAVTFLGTWHKANMRFAALILNRHQDEAHKILWDIAVDAAVVKDNWYRRYYPTAHGSKRFVLHEAFVPGQIIGINCVVPATISDDDFWKLMTLAGQYRGLSPAKPGEYGQYEVVSIYPRRAQPGHETDNEQESNPVEIGQPADS